jgi:hypothetical protein
MTLLSFVKMLKMTIRRKFRESGVKVWYVRPAA